MILWMRVVVWVTNYGGLEEKWMNRLKSVEVTMKFLGFILATLLPTLLFEVPVSLGTIYLVKSTKMSKIKKVFLVNLI